MLKAARSTRALHEAQASKEDVTVEESSPRIKRKKIRQALGDVSNNKARNGAGLEGSRSSVPANVEKRSSQRSQVSSSISSANEDRNPNNYETKRALSEIEQSKNDNHNATLPSTEAGVTQNVKLPPFIPGKTETKKNKNANRTKKRGGSFDIESALLEPRPKRTRQKATKLTIAIQKKEFNLAKEATKNAEMRNSKVKTPDAASSELPSSTKTLIPSNHRRLDPHVQSDDEHCLPRKLEGPFDASKFTTGIATYDKASTGNVGEVPAYVTDIFQRLFDAERITKASPSYMTDEQDEINSTMRAILVNWLVGVQVKFRLQPETLYLCVNIIDRYLSKARIPRRRLQLLGVTSLFVACKYEEIYPLEAKDCVYLTNRLYNRQEVLDMEIEIVMVLGFRMTVSTAYPFLQRFLHITNAPKIIRDLASFYTERMLQEYCMLNFRGSLVASAAVCLAWNNPAAMEILEETETSHELPRVLDTIVNYTGFCEKQIRHAATVMCQKLQPPSNAGQHGRPTTQELDKVDLKYKCEAHSKASCFDLPNINHLDS